MPASSPRSGFPTRSGFSINAVVRKSITAAATGSGNWSVSARQAGGVTTSSYGSCSVTAQPADRFDAADDVPASVGGVGLTDIGQRFRVAQDRDRLLQLGQILWA